ncbi:MAG: hypothetical protein L6Q57_02300 [Alphaproteobacteria bacterium]|nr:hypothetical protein [Alphaproteobacteria bacterium]
MQSVAFQRIQDVIEETNDAFSFCGSVNTDYAEFAALSIHAFKQALSDPGLTRGQLVQMLREGMREHPPEYHNLRGWAGMMARYVSHRANGNESQTRAF